jgi:hypothetical protein
MKYLARVIEIWDCGSLFKSKIEAAQYPNFIINVDTMEVIDLPSIIDLDIPDS